MIHNLGLNHSLINQFVAELRDVEIQKDSLRFRNNMIRLGEIFAYEISKTMDFSEIEVTTSLGMARTPTLSQQPVLATILRAGLPLHQGLLNFFDHADNALSLHIADIITMARLKLKLITYQVHRSKTEF